MNISSLRLLGFKTFARTSELTFGSGITAVVGPNGSGKSNIVDALRWVLGERQAREVRGDVMDDVIYAGSATKSGGSGRLGMAEVELVLDNSDGDIPVPYSEVSIRRRIIRGGDIEYWLNGTRARRRDIEDLLDATGLMVHGYSVIAQHDVDRVIYATADERRHLLEEAAGIRLYHAVITKARSITKIAELHADQSTGILEELRPRFVTVSEQAAATLSFRVLDAQRVSYQGDRDRVEWRAAKARLKDARKKADLAQSAARDASEHLASITDTYRALQEQRDAAFDAVQAAQQRLGGMKSQAHGLLQSQEHLKDTTASTRSHWWNTEHQALEGFREQQRAQHELEDLRRSSSTLGATDSQFQQQVDARRMLWTEARVAIDTLRDELVQQDTTYASAIQQLRHIDEELAAVEQRVQRYESDAATTQEQYTLINHDCVGLENEVSVTLDTLNTAVQLLANISTLVASSEDAVNSCAQHRSLAEQHVADLINEQIRLEGERSAQEAKRRALEGTHGAISDALSQIPQDAYRLIDGFTVNDPLDMVAIEAVLGDALLNWCVESVDTVMTAAPHTAEAESAWEKSNIEKNVGVWTPPIGRPALSALTITDASATHVLTTLLGNVVLAQNYAQARTFVTGSPYTAVLPDGTILQDGFLNVGVASRHALRTTKEMRNLEHELTVLAEKIIGSGEALEQARLQERQATLHMAEIRTATLTATKEAHEAEVRHATLSQSLDGKRTRALALHQEHADALEAIAALRTEHAKCQQERTQAQAHVEMVLHHTQAVRTAVEKASNQERVLNANLKEAESQARASEAERRTIQATTERVASEIALHEAQRHRWSELLARDEMLFLSYGLQYRMHLASSVELEREVATAQQQLHAAELQARDADAHRLQVEQSRAEAEVLHFSAAHTVQSTQALFDIALTTFDAISRELAGIDGEDDEEWDPSALERVDRDLRRVEREIASLGPVNPFAPEEAERLGLVVGKLEKGIAELTASIGDITYLSGLLQNRCAMQFATTVEQVTEVFQSLFSELFPGGSATLVCTAPPQDATQENTDEAIPLPSIELIAQPGGKRRMPLERLSGGEKALTSLAFLLAMQQVNPSPFYVFDEVDASLDDSNVVRLTHLLKRLAQDRQFIVVTHNQITMNIASVLYGVTVDAKGVSSVLNLSLDHLVGPDADAGVTGTTIAHKQQLIGHRAIERTPSIPVTR